MQGCSLTIAVLFLLFSPGSRAESPATEVQLLEKSILSLRTQPTQPLVGKHISTFLEVKSDFFRQEVVLEGLLGSAPARLEKTGENLWTANFDPFSEVKSHELLISIYLRDKQEASRYQASLNIVNREIRELDAAIEAEIDPIKKAALEATRTEKQAYATELETALEGLKVFLKSETFHFSVEADPANANYPHLTAVSPSAIPLDTRVRLTLTGQNFSPTATVRVNSQNATVLSVSPTSIDVLGPRILSEGPKSIEIIFPPQDGNPRKNTILTNSLFVTSRDILKNLRPVAVTRGYQRVVWPVTGPAQLEASNSYDENGDAYSHAWVVKASPAGSALVAGTVLENSPTPSVTFDKVGIFRIELRLHETSTEELLSSRLSTVTVEVK